MKTLFVAADEAKAPVLVTRLKTTALHKAVKVCFAFMGNSFLCDICLSLIVCVITGRFVRLLLLNGYCLNIELAPIVPKYLPIKRLP